MSKYPFYRLLQDETGAFQLFRKKEKHSPAAPSVSSPPSTFIEAHYRQLAEGEYKNLVSFVGLTADDLQRLANVRPLFEKHVSKIVNAFYDHIGNMPHLAQIIQSHSTIDRLKQTLRAYLLDMVSGEVGEQYVLRRKVIGQVHHRINLFPEWYLGAYVIIQNEVLRMLMQELPPHEAADVYHSFMKLCWFDIQIAITTYIETHTSSMMKLSEIEELQHRLTKSSTALAASAEETTASVTDREKCVNEMLNEINSIQTQSSEMIAKVENGKHDVARTLTKLDNVAQLVEGTKALTTELADSSKKSMKLSPLSATSPTRRIFYLLTQILKLRAPANMGKGLRLSLVKYASWPYKQSSLSTIFKIISISSNKRFKNLRQRFSASLKKRAYSAKRTKASSKCLKTQPQA